MGQDVVRITEEPRYAEIIRRWEAFWALEDVGRPLWLVPTNPALAAAEARLAPMRPLLQDKAIQLQASLAVLQWRESVGLDDDFVPHLQPQQGVTVFASAFGCQVDFFGHTMPWAHPVIAAGDPPEKVYDPPTPAVTDGQLGTILEFTDYFAAETKRRYPLALTDLQGPLDSAYLVWEPGAFMVAMYTNPREVHHLMRLVTDLIVRFVKEQRARSPEFLPCHWPPLWLPDGRGISVSDDCLAVLSPQLYREFALPYLNELSEEFGGVFVHSCGDFSHQLDNLAKVHDLRGINFGVTETPFRAVWERFGGKTAIVPHVGLNTEVHFSSHEDFIRHVLGIADHCRGLCLVVVPHGDPARLTDPGFAADFVRSTKALLEP